MLNKTFRVFDKSVEICLNNVQIKGDNIMDFTKKNLLELRKLSIEELSKYYMQQRKWKFEKGVALKNIELRNKIHKLLVFIIKIDRLLAKEGLEVINDDRIKTDKPKIFTCTHIGGNDIQRTFEAIKDPAYLFLGDPKGVYRDVSGLLLYLNGMIALETSDKEDRRIAKIRSIELLNNGGNLLIYPEGAWNITQNLPVMKLYDGASSMALETGADIIPVAIEQYENNFFVSIGENILTSQLSGIEIKELTSLIRNKMATEKWKILENNGIVKRENVACYELEKFQQAIIDRCGYGFTIQDVIDTMYHDKTVTEPEEVFETYMKKFTK